MRSRQSRSRFDRRSFLALLAIGTTGTLAGCLGDDDDTVETPTPNPTPTPTETPTDVVDPEQLEARASTFVELLIEDEFDDAYELVSDTFEAELPPEDLEAVWSQHIEPLGAFQGFTSVEYQGETPEGAPHVVAFASFDAGGVRFDIVFDDGEVYGFFLQPVGEWTPPAYIDDDAFTEEEVTLSAPGDCELGATLTRPTAEEAPGIVLVHGSGDQDRDQTIGPNRTFKEIAQGLATQGIAVLRYDKRPYACSIERTTATVDDIITDDAVTAIERLEDDDRITDVYVAGHSLGGRLAPRIAARGDVDGVVLLAPSGEPVYEVLVRQNRHVFELDGELSDEEEAALAEVEALAERIRTLDIGDDEVLDIAGGRGRSFFETLRAVEHTEAIVEVDVPTLLIQGGRDYLVTTDDDLPIWEAALDDVSEAEIVVFDDLNHRFQAGTDPATPQEWFEPEHPVDERVVETIAGFVLDSEV